MVDKFIEELGDGLVVVVRLRSAHVRLEEDAITLEAGGLCIESPVSGLVGDAQINPITIRCPPNLAQVELTRSVAVFKLGTGAPG